MKSDRAFDCRRPALRVIGPLLMLCIALAGVEASAQRVDEATASFHRGELLANKNNFAGAIESFTKAISLKPNWADAYLQRGHARRMKGELDNAIEDYDKATELDPRITRNNRMSGQAYTNHGQNLALKLQLEDAIVAFDKAIKTFSGDERPYFERAQAKLLLEDFTGAIADYDLYLTKNSHDPFGRARGYSERGLAKHLLGRNQEGENDVKKAIEIMGKNGPDIIEQLAFLERELNALRRVRAQKKKIG